MDTLRDFFLYRVILSDGATVLAVLLPVPGGMVEALSFLRGRFPDAESIEVRRVPVKVGAGCSV